jgi:hypothetical protein
VDRDAVTSARRTEVGVLVDNNVTHPPIAMVDAQSSTPPKQSPLTRNGMKSEWVKYKLGLHPGYLLIICPRTHPHREPSRLA